MYFDVMQSCMLELIMSSDNGATGMVVFLEPTP